MKKNFIYKTAFIGLATFAIGGILFQSNSSYFVDADNNGEYTLFLSNSLSYSNGETTVFTNNGNPITLKTDGDSNNNIVTLDINEYLTNKNPLSGLSGINISYTGGNLKVATSYERMEEAFLTYTSIQSGSLFNISNNSNYFVLKSDSDNVSIKSIYLTYSCQNIAKQYNITFKNDDGTVLQTSKVSSGTIPTYNGETPSKANIDNASFTFKGWDKQISPANKDEIYTATYDINLPFDPIEMTYLGSEGNLKRIELNLNDVYCNDLSGNPTHFGGGWYSSGYLILPNNACRLDYNLAGHHVVAAFSFYNQYGTLISTLGGPDTGANSYALMNDYIDIPSDAKYVRIAAEISYSTNAVYVSTTPFAEMIDLSDSTHIEVFSEWNAPICYSSSSNPQYSYLQECSYGGWINSDWIEIPDDVVSVKYKLACHQYLNSITYFDSNKTPIKGESFHAGNALYYGIHEDTSYVPLNAKYMKILNFDGYDAEPAFVDYYARMYTTLNSISNRTKIVCLGDSLTEGDYGLVKGEAHVFPENYPYYLNKYLHSNVTNYGKCGYNTVSYLNHLNAGNVDVANADIVLIMLGTNWGLVNTAEYNFYDSYLGIINWVKNANPNAKIVLCTPPHVTSNENKVNCGHAQWVDPAGPIVKSVANSYSLPVIDVYTDSGITTFTEEIYQPNDGLHFGKLGYKKLATFIGESLKQIYPNYFL